MNQYCRYCCNGVLTENESDVWCEHKGCLMTESQAKRVNKCKHFEFNENDMFRMNADGTFATYNPKKS